MSDQHRHTEPTSLHRARGLLGTLGILSLIHVLSLDGDASSLGVFLQEKLLCWSSSCLFVQ